MKYEQQQSGGSYGGSQVLAWLCRLYDWHWELGNCRLDCDLLIVTYALSWCEDTIFWLLLISKYGKIDVVYCRSHLRRPRKAVAKTAGWGRRGPAYKVFVKHSIIVVVMI